MSNQEQEQEFSFKSLFVPLTTLKAIHFIVITGLIVFFNSLFNGFVWDDSFQIVNNGYVQSGQAFYYFTHTIGPFYRPLMLLLYTILFQLFHLQAFFYHLLQVTIHIINAILVFWLFRYFSKNILFSFLSSLIFLVHPMSAEPVDYIANLQDVLFVFFGLMALFVTIKQKFGRYSEITSSLLLLSGLFSKETGVLFVALYIVYILIFREGKSRLKYLFFPAAAISIYLLIRFMTIGFISLTDNYNFTPQQDMFISAPLTQRILSTPKIIHFYLKTFFWPADLTPQYWFVKSISFSEFIFPLIIDTAVLGGIIYIGIFLRKKRSISHIYYYFAIWFFLGIAFHSQIIPLEKTATDRWFYFPMIGLLGMTTICISHLKIKFSQLQTNLFFLLLIIIYISLSIRTIVRNTNWYSDLTLFSHDIVSLQNVGDIQYNYATALMNNGQVDAAITHLKKAGALEPNSDSIWLNLGVAYFKKNKLNEAESNFRKAISLKPDKKLAYFNLIIVLILRGKADEAKKINQSALIMWPKDAALWRMLGIAKYILNDKDSARSAFGKSESLMPNTITEYYQSQLEQNLPIDLKNLKL